MNQTPQNPSKRDCRPDSIQSLINWRLDSSFAMIFWHMDQHVPNLVSAWVYVQYNITWETMGSDTSNERLFISVEERPSMQSKQQQEMEYTWAPGLSTKTNPACAHESSTNPPRSYSFPHPNKLSITVIVTLIVDADPATCNGLVSFDTRGTATIDDSGLRERGKWIETRRTCDGLKNAEKQLHFYLCSTNHKRF